MGRVEQTPTSRRDSKAPCREGVPVPQAKEIPKVTNVCRSLNPTEMVWWGPWRDTGWKRELGSSPAEDQHPGNAKTFTEPLGAAFAATSAEDWGQHRGLGFAISASRSGHPSRCSKRKKKKFLRKISETEGLFSHPHTVKIN